MSARRGRPPKQPAKRASSDPGSLLKYITVTQQPVSPDRVIRDIFKLADFLAELILPNKKHDGPAQSMAVTLKGRRKDKDSPTPPTQDEFRQYLEDQCVRDRITDADFYKLVSLPPCLDYNEWLATHTISFFNHVNLMYGVISEFCTSDSCLTMTGPGNVQYFWNDEKGKKYKESAPQYVDYVTLYIQKTISDESVFPTKFGQVFPTTFESTVKKIHRYLFHILAHIYHVHYKELTVLAINGHINSLFTHFMVFSLKFDLLEEKEYEVLNELLKALIKQLPDPNQNEGTEVTEISRT